MPVQHRLLQRAQSANGRLNGHKTDTPRQKFLRKLFNYNMTSTPAFWRDPIGKIIKSRLLTHLAL